MTQFVFGLLAGIIVGLVMEWVIDWSGLFPKRTYGKRATPRKTQTKSAPVSIRVAEATPPVTLESNTNSEPNEG